MTEVLCLSLENRQELWKGRRVHEDVHIIVSSQIAQAVWNIAPADHDGLAVVMKKSQML